MAVPIVMAAPSALTAISALKDHPVITPMFSGLSTLRYYGDTISLHLSLHPWDTEAYDELTISQTTRADCREEL